MSFIKDALFGQKATPTQVVNTTPSAFQNLASPTSAALMSLLGFGGPPQPGTAYSAGNIVPTPQQPSGATGQSPYYQGPYAAQLGAPEWQALLGAQQAAGQVGQAGAGQQALATQAAGQMNPLAGQMNPFAGQMNPFAGQMNPFAGLTGLEQFGLGQVTQQAFAPSPFGQAAQNPLLGMIGGQMNPYAQAAGLSDAEQQGINAIQQTAFNNPLQQQVSQQLGQIATGNNPLTAQLIEAAQRPILDNFSDEALRQRGLYTAAGQQVQGQGSSPFAQASARLAGNTQSALNDAALGVTSQAFGQQLQGLGMAQAQPGLQLSAQLGALGAAGLPREIQQLGLNLGANAFGQMQQNQLAAAGLGDQLTGNALQRALAGLGAAGVGQERQGAAFESAAARQGAAFESAAARQGAAFESAAARQGEAFEGAAGRQLQAGTSLAGADLAGQQAQLQAQLQNLQAQGLPRMISQLGIDAGLQQFNQQQSQYMDLLRLMGSLAQPNATVLPGTPGTGGLLGSFANAFGQAAGEGLAGLIPGLSDRRLKKDISTAGALDNGVALHRFRYVWEADDAPLRLGVMADEVEHIPGAVTRHGPHNVAVVDYSKVMAHG